MRTIHPANIAHALNNCDTGHLARALAASANHPLTRLVEALISAADHRATYPREEVNAEADALLYDVLRWPVADASPDWNHAVTTASFAARTGVSLHEAQASLARLRDTEPDAARALLAAGPVTNFNLEQAQGTDSVGSNKDGKGTTGLARPHDQEPKRSPLGAPHRCRPHQQHPHWCLDNPAPTPRPLMRQSNHPVPCWTLAHLRVLS